LFWQLDLSKRSFVNLNDSDIGILGLENYRFFKDREYRIEMLFPDDRDSMERAVANFKDRVPVRMIFRVRDGKSLHWYKLMGWPTSDFRYYEGSVEEITAHIDWLKNAFDQQDRHLLEVVNADYPVAIFSAKDRQLLNANRYFQKNLGIIVSSGKRYRLDDLVHGDIKFPLILENLLLERHLTLELLLGCDNKIVTRATCSIEYFSHEGAGYIRLAIIEQIASKKIAPEKAQQSAKIIELKQICSDLAQCSSIDAMLERIYFDKKLFSGMDVVMFSDIYARKNRVIVYSKGDMDNSLEPGSQFPYAGTIAENIEKENLEYLIVDDTQSSIKAIDWMLFVPNGISSYVAKALYVRGAMRTVLILCSFKKNTFTEDQIPAVTAIAKAFHRQLKQIRKLSTS
jgi:hypothetical protein